MSDGHPIHSIPSKRSGSGAVEGEVGPQRRKLRKGTQSCWECRRRKIRCVFSSHDAACTHCGQRGLHCVSQHLPDTGRVSQGTDRIARVENLVEEVLGRLQVPPAAEHRPPEKKADNDGRVTQGGKRSDEPDAIVTGGNVQGASNHHPGKARMNMSSSEHVREIRAELRSILPSGHDLAAIQATPFDVPGSLMDLPYIQTCLDEHGGQCSLKTLLRLDNVDAPLVTLSRSILMLSSILQSLPQQSAKQLEDAGIDYLDIERRGIWQTRQHVLYNDELVQSSDGVECLAIEAMYWNSAGELRKAWLGIRRAMTFAQMLGLHKGNQRFQGRENSGDTLWFFLVCSDRYLSLTLGLPPCTVDDSWLAGPKVLALSMPRQQMQRLHCVASGHILQRKAANGWDAGSIDFVDRILKDAAAAMSPEWWAFPTSPPKLPQDDAGSGAERHRLMDQMVHFNLLSRLHLPYLLQSGDGGKYSAHGLVTISASRNVLMRYLSFRSLTTTCSYCRGIDFSMFLAAVTLCVAHIEACRWIHNDSSSILSFLDHERLGDRGLISRVLEVVKQPPKETQDSIGAPMAVAIEHLLRCEAQAAAEGKLFAVYRSEDNTSADNMISELSQAGDRLDVSIPWIGVIRVEPNYATDQLRDTSHEAAHQLEPDLSFFGDDYSLQGVDVALFEDLFRGMDPTIPDL